MTPRGTTNPPTVQADTSPCRYIHSALCPGSRTDLQRGKWLQEALISWNPGELTSGVVSRFWWSPLDLKSSTCWPDDVGKVVHAPRLSITHTHTVVMNIRCDEPCCRNFWVWRNIGFSAHWEKRMSSWLCGAGDFGRWGKRQKKGKNHRKMYLYDHSQTPSQLYVFFQASWFLYLKITYSGILIWGGRIPEDPEGRSDCWNIWLRPCLLQRSAISWKKKKSNEIYETPASI